MIRTLVFFIIDRDQAAFCVNKRHAMHSTDIRITRTSSLALIRQQGYEFGKGEIELWDNTTHPNTALRGEREHE